MVLKPDITNETLDKGICPLQDLHFELQAQDEQADSVLEDLRVISSIASTVSLQSVSENGIQLQEIVQNTHQLFTEVEERTEKSIQALDR